MCKTISNLREQLSYRKNETDAINVKWSDVAKSIMFIKLKVNITFKDRITNIFAV